MRGRAMGERGEDSFLAPFSHFTISHQTSIFGLLAKEGAVLQSTISHVSNNIVVIYKTVERRNG